MKTTGSGGAAVFLARLQAVVEELEVGAALGEIDAAKAKQESLRGSIAAKEAAMDHEQAELERHLDRGPGPFQSLTGIGNHEQVTNQRKAAVEMKEAELQKDEVRLSRERDAIAEAISGMGAALRGAESLRNDLEASLDADSRLAAKALRV